MRRAVGDGQQRRTKKRRAPAFDDFSAFAGAYARVTRDNVCNAHYERPAIRALVGEVRHKRVLDAGCAAGEHAMWLTERGAQVVAVDLSAEMVALARERLGARADVRQADFGQPLPFADGAFDLVFSSLSLHYLQDWAPTLREFYRVLRPGGELLFSTHHPMAPFAELPNYFATTLIEQTWAAFGEPVRVRFYHRPLGAIFAAVAHAGFTVAGLIEPRPTEAAKTVDPIWYDKLSEHPWFLIVRASRGGAG